MTKTISPPPAPEILEPALASEVGSFMLQITQAKPDFLSFFESPRFGRLDFTRDSFEREVASVVGDEDAGKAFDLFQKAGLLKRVLAAADIERVAPTCRVNHCVVKKGVGTQNVFICTDSPVVDFDKRVFPWVDEGEALLSSIASVRRAKEPKRILDLCSGAGTTGLLLGKLWPNSYVVGIDNNARACKYAEFNARLNDLKNFKFITHDLMNPRPLSHILPDDDLFDIVAVDPPFTSMPPGITGYAHSSSTQVLAESLVAALGQVKTNGTVVMLCYSYGPSDAPTQLREILETLNLTSFHEAEISLLPNQMWRLHGEKSNPLNPMPVQFMAPRYHDPDWHHKFIESNYAYSDYVLWIQNQLANRGLTHLHYVSLVLRKRSDNKGESSGRE